jgi:hypothetical protein
MEKLNLFGVPLEDLDDVDLSGLDESMKEKNRKRKFVRDLLNVLETLDEELDPNGDGTLQNFEKPKRFIHFDPYADAESLHQEIEDVQLNSLKFEDDIKLRASIVMSAYEVQFKKIDKESLTYEDKEKYERV